MNFSWLSDPVCLQYLRTGLRNTAVLMVMSGVLGFALAGLVALAQEAEPEPLGWAARATLAAARRARARRD